MLSHYRLPGQLPDEKVIRIIRKTWFVLFKKIIVFVILAILPGVFFLLVVPQYFFDLTASPLRFAVVAISIAVYYLYLWLFFFFSFIDYYLDLWVITNARIIDVRQEGFFARTIAEQRLSRMQDVTSEVKGFFPTILGFGNIYVQTAAEKQRFFFESIPNPDKIRDLLIKLGEEAVQEGHHQL